MTDTEKLNPLKTKVYALRSNMHYHCEVILPPVDNVKEVLDKALAPFSESADPEEASNHTFYDYFRIGGRWSGHKRINRLGEERLTAFWDWAKEEGLTQSSFQAGKPSLKPESQIPKVDAKWQELFPGEGDTCPFFNHSKADDGDICALIDIPDGLTAETVAIITPSYDNTLRAKSIFQESYWNGCNHQETTWDGKLSSALEEHMSKLERYTDEARERYTPQKDWLVVTVDYHS